MSIVKFETYLYSTPVVDPLVQSISDLFHNCRHYYIGRYMFYDILLAVDPRCRSNCDIFFVTELNGVSSNIDTIFFPDSDDSDDENSNLINNNTTETDTEIND